MKFGPDMSYYATPRTDLVDLSQNSSVPALEVGCGTGATAQLLVERGIATHVDGVEISPQVAALATQTMRVVTVGNIETIDIKELLAGEGYKTIVLGDVLEHLVDPWRVLRSLVRNLEPGCEVLISLPNIRNLRVILPLVIKGSFEYSNQGLLDKTHLRFFSHSSMVDLISSAGLAIEQQSAQRAGGIKYPWTGRLTKIFGPFLTDQYTFRCVKQ